MSDIKHKSNSYKDLGGYYTLPENVYFVRGALRGAIYHLGTGNLYSIDKDASIFLNSLEHKFIKFESITTQQKLYLETFLQLQLIQKSNKRGPFNKIASLKETYPINFAWIEITRQCNLSCSFCYEGSNIDCTEKMSFDDFKFVVKNLIDMDINKIQLIGGEPMLLKNDFRKMIEYAQSRFTYIEVYTNGILISKKWCEFFKRNNVHIALSVHSYLSGDHDDVTHVRGSHAKVENAIQLLKDYDIPYRLGTVRSKTCKVGDGPINRVQYHLRPKPQVITSQLNLKETDFEMFKERAIIKKSKQKKLDKDMIKQLVSGHQCFMTNLYVSTSLEVYPCVMERRITHGNLRNNKLINIIDNTIRGMSKDFIEGCKTCEYRYTCFDCRPNSNGRGLYEQPWYCTYNPLDGEWNDVMTVWTRLIDQMKTRENE
jgi:radical SAM protein with 4Fe4S-binding SPASM domain